MTTHRGADGEARVDALLRTTPTRVLRGQEATAAARAMMSSAGVDVAALEERITKGGRPRLDGEPTGQGVRSPRVNVSIPAEVEDLLNQRANELGVNRSQVVRDALVAYLVAS